MTDNELDNLFKNTFTNHEAPIPDDMWQRIQPGGSKKRPVVFWWKWYAAAAVFLIAGMATWWYVDTTGAKNNKSLSYNTSSNKENNQQTTPDTGIKNDGNASLLQNSSLDKQQTNTTKSTTAHELQLALSQSTNGREVLHSKINVNPSGSTNKVTPDLNATALSQKYGANSNDHDYSPSADNLNNSNTDLAEAQASSNLTKENKNNAPTGGDFTKQSPTLGNTNNISNTAASNTKKENKKAKHPWTLEVFGTSAYADKKTYGIVKENTIIVGAAPIPPPQPKPSLWNYGVGVRLGIPILKNITLKTGLQFSQTIQKAGYQQQNIVDMISVRDGDTSFSRQIVYETEQQKSTYNSLSVPVLVSYQTGKKIKVGATAGVIVNAYNWYTGKVPNSSFTTTLEAKETYKHNTGAALYAGVTVAKKLGTIEFFAEPHLQYSLSNFAKPTVPFKQKINTYGLSIGVRTNLHK